MPLPTLSYAQSSSSLHLNGPSAASLPPPPSASSISLPALWHTLVEHGSNKRKALTSIHEQSLTFLQHEIDRIALKFELYAAHRTARHCCPAYARWTLSDCVSIAVLSRRAITSDVVEPSTKRSRPNSGAQSSTNETTATAETTAERLARLHSAQQQAIVTMQTQLLKDEVPSPPPPPSPSSPSPSSSDQENVPPPSSSPLPSAKPSKAAKKKRAKPAPDTDAEVAFNHTTDDDSTDAIKPARAKKRHPSSDDDAPAEPKPSRKAHARKAEVVEEARPVRTRAAAKKDADVKDAVVPAEAAKPKKGGRKKKAKEPASAEADDVSVPVEVAESAAAVADVVMGGEKGPVTIETESMTVVEVVAEPAPTPVNAPHVEDIAAPSLDVPAPATRQPSLADLEEAASKRSPTLPPPLPALYPTPMSITPPALPTSVPSPVPSPTSPSLPGSGGFFSYMPNSLASILKRFTPVQPLPKAEHVGIATALSAALSPSVSPSTSPTLPPVPTPSPPPVLREEGGGGAGKTASKKERLLAQFESSQREQAAKMEEARQLGGGSGGSARSSTNASTDSIPGAKNVGHDQTVAEHVQVIDLDHPADDDADLRPKEMEPTESDALAIPPLTRDDGPHGVVAVDEVVKDVQAVDVDTAVPSEPVIDVIDTDADAAMADDVDSLTPDGREPAAESALLERAKEPTKDEKLKRAKALKEADALRKKEKASEAARKRDEAERKRKALLDDERRKLADESRRKEELKRQRDATTADKKKAATVVKGQSGSSKGKTEGVASKKAEKNIAKTAPPGLLSGTTPPLVSKPLNQTMTAGREEEGERVREVHSHGKEKTLSMYTPVDSPVKAEETMAPAVPLVVADTAVAPTSAPLPPPIPVKKQPPVAVQQTPQPPAPASGSEAAPESKPEPLPLPLVSPVPVLPPAPVPLVKSGAAPSSPDSAMSPPPAKLPTAAVKAATSSTQVAFVGSMPPPPSLPMPPATPSPAVPHPTPSTKATKSPTTWVISAPHPPLRAGNADNYPMSDHSDEDVDESPDTKRVPSWAREPALSAALRAQALACVDPDLIFPPIDPYACSLEDIFKGYEKKKKFRSRSSSGNWGLDQLSAREEMQYKREMGYIKG